MEQCKNHQDMHKTPKKIMEKEGYGNLLTPEFSCKPVHIEEQIKGNIDNGEIIHLGQVHASPFDNEQSGNIIMAHQKDIYEKLKIIQPKYLVIEGDYGQFSQFIQQFSDSGKDTSIDSPDNKKILWLLGGAFFYALENKDVTLIHGENQEYSQNAVQKFYSDLGDQIAKQEVLDGREDIVIDNIKNTLQHDKGASIVIVYGAGHDFSNNIGKKFDDKTMPNLQKITFPKAMVDRMKIAPQNPLTGQKWW